MAERNIMPSKTIKNQSKQNLTNHELPGPGTYNTAYSTFKTDHSQDRLPKSKRFSQQKVLAPGPGSYDQHKITHSQAAIVLSKSKITQTDTNPGPGTYEADFSKIVKRNSGYKIGTSQKLIDYSKSAKNLPGPGQYDTAKSTFIEKNHAPTLGIQRKIQLGYDPKTPGPGKYDQKAYYNTILSNQPKIVFSRANRSQSTKSFAPGPGAYAVRGEIQEAVSRKKGVKIGEKINPSHLDQKFIPGPGTYTQTSTKIYKKSMPSFSMGKQAKLKIQNFRQIMSKPGPLSYDNKITAFENKAFVIGKDKRKDLGNESNVPGPGAYDMKNIFRSSSFAVPKSQRKSLADNKIVPGPFAYNPKPVYDGKYQTISIGTDHRRDDYKKQGPGPSDYFKEQKNSQNGFTIGHQKRDHQKHQNIPGPGQYDIPSAIFNTPNHTSAKSK